MKIRIKNGTATIEGYVNAVERFSKTLSDKKGKFIEMIKPKVFERALEKNKEVLTLLNHDYDRVLAKTSDNTCELVEDNIGLRAKVQITDEEVIEKAEKGKLRGWSFGFKVRKLDSNVNKDGLEERTIRELELFEVSIIDDKYVPAYYGTSIEMRGDEEEIIEYRFTKEEVDVEAEEKEAHEEKKNLTYNEKSELLRKKLKEENKDEEVWINDFDDNYIYANFYKENQTYKIPYTIKDDEAQLDFANKVKIKLQYVEERADTYKYRNRADRLKMK